MGWGGKGRAVRPQSSKAKLRELKLQRQQVVVFVVAQAARRRVTLRECGVMFCSVFVSLRVDAPARPRTPLSWLPP